MYKSLVMSVCLSASQDFENTEPVVMKFDMIYWGVCGMVNMHLNFEHNHSERTDGPIGIKFSISTWGGYGMANS